MAPSPQGDISSAFREINEVRHRNGQILKTEKDEVLDYKNKAYWAYNAIKCDLVVQMFQ